MVSERAAAIALASAAQEYLYSAGWPDASDEARATLTQNFSDALKGALRALDDGPRKGHFLSLLMWRCVIAGMYVPVSILLDALPNFSFCEFPFEPSTTLLHCVRDDISEELFDAILSTPRVAWHKERDHRGMTPLMRYVTRNRDLPHGVPSVTFMVCPYVCESLSGNGMEDILNMLRCTHADSEVAEPTLYPLPDGQTPLGTSRLIKIFVEFCDLEDYNPFNDECSFSMIRCMYDQPNTVLAHAISNDLFDPTFEKAVRDFRCAETARIVVPVGTVNVCMSMPLYVFAALLGKPAGVIQTLRGLCNPDSKTIAYYCDKEMNIVVEETLDATETMAFVGSLEGVDSNHCDNTLIVAFGSADDKLVDGNFLRKIVRFMDVSVLTSMQFVPGVCKLMPSVRSPCYGSLLHCALDIATPMQRLLVAHRSDRLLTTLEFLVDAGVSVQKLDFYGSSPARLAVQNIGCPRLRSKILKLLTRGKGIVQTKASTRKRKLCD